MNAITRFFANVFGGFFDKRLWSQYGAAKMTTAKVEVSEEIALNYSAIWCATRLLCGTGAQLPLPVFSGADDETREKVRSHPVFHLLNIAPNNEQTAFNFRSVMWQWQVNWGNAYAEIVTEGRQPDAPVMELWPIHPSRVKVKRDENDSLYYEVYEFTTASYTELEPWQMLHLPSIITYDGIVGHGVIQHARETVGAGIAAEKKAANNFGSGGIPAIVVEHPGKWNQDVRDAFRKEWKEIHGGPDGDNVALLQGGALAKPLMAMSERDSQYLESRQFSVEEIARWYGIPPHLLQHLLRATFDNIEELGLDFVRYCLMPWLEIWEQGIRQKLFTLREQETLFVEHNVDALLRGNAAARGELYKAMTGAAIMNRNECRKLENLDPVDGGDVFLVQGAMVALDESGKPESNFAGGRAVSSTNGQQPNAKIAESIQRVIKRELSLMLTKETNAMASYAKKPSNFVARVDDFYTLHRNLMVDVMAYSAEAMSLCGQGVDGATLAATWVSEGKSLILEAAGSATPNELPAAVERVFKSKSWSERPSRAFERAKNATSLV